LPLPAQMSLSKLNPQCALPAPIGTPNEEAVRPLTRRKGRSKWQVRGERRSSVYRPDKGSGYGVKRRHHKGWDWVSAPGVFDPACFRSCLLRLILPVSAGTRPVGVSISSPIWRAVAIAKEDSRSPTPVDETFPGNFEKARNLNELGPRARAIGERFRAAARRQLAIPWGP
jgi:hypothetical protein